MYLLDEALERIQVLEKQVIKLQESNVELLANCEGAFNSLNEQQMLTPDEESQLEGLERVIEKAKGDTNGG